MEIVYTSEDKSLEYKLVYISKRKLRGYKGDKTMPVVTQCLLFKNGLLQDFAEVVKCESDKHNPQLAYKLVTKKVMPSVYFTDIKTELWKLFFELNPIK